MTEKTSIEFFADTTTFSPNNTEILDPNDPENLSSKIMDFTLSESLQLEALNLLYKYDPENVTEIVNRIVLLYESTTVSSLKNFLFVIATKSNIDPVTKSICCKGLLTVNKNDDLGLTALATVYPLLSTATTTYKFELIKVLLESAKFREECKTFFCGLIENVKIDSKFRYRMIVELAKKDTLKMDACSAFVETRVGFSDVYTNGAEYLVREGCYIFAQNIQNEILYRLLACQKFLSFSEGSSLIENILLSFAKDPKVEYNLRADSADVLLKYSAVYKDEAKMLILELGSQGKKPKTLYDNAQNVHTDEIENSVLDALSFLHTFELARVAGPFSPFISFDYVEKKILELSKDDFSLVQVALNRIYMDSALYSKYNCTLNHILLRIWTYIDGHKSKEDLQKRLVQELKDMAGTCSSGFASRLVNVMSGYGDFSLKISWRDQIESNITGRLNAKIRDLDDLKLQELIIAEMTEGSFESGFDDAQKQRDPTLPMLNRESLEKKGERSRRHFLEFFRAVLPSIRAEMWIEFKPHVSTTDFDLYFRSAVIKYESGDRAV